MFLMRVLCDRDLTQPIYSYFQTTMDKDNSNPIGLQITSHFTHRFVMRPTDSLSWSVDLLEVILDCDL